jgi:hypothetical protein
MLYIVLDSGAGAFSGWWFLVAPSVSLIILIYEKVFGEVRRLKFSALIFGLFFVLPLLLFLTFPLMMILTTPSFGMPTRLAILCVVCAFSLYLCRWKIQNLKEALTRTNYLSKELKPCGDGSYWINGDKARDIDKLMKKYGKAHSNTWLLPSCFGLFALGLVLERAMLIATEAEGFFIVLAVFETPLAMYVLWESAAGFYLWVLAVGRFEKENHGKAYHHNRAHVASVEARARSSHNGPARGGQQLCKLKSKKIHRDTM